MSLSQAGEQAPGAPRMVPVWDILVRTGHWLLVVCFTVSYLTEGDLLTIHSWSGYVIAGYVAVRAIWGVIGPRHARFSDFAFGPRAALGYLGELIRFRAPRYMGHSPAGGLMVMALLGALALTTLFGMAALAVEKNKGPLAPWLGGQPVAAAPAAPPALVSPAYADSEREPGENREGEGEGSFFGEIHEVLANFTLILVFMHIGGVAIASLVHRENLPRSMVTGLKRAE